MDPQGPILLFDGVCHLCCGSVQFVLKRNKKENVRFAPLQSNYGQQALKSISLPANYTSSLVLLENDKVYLKSDAALRLLLHVDGIWKIGVVFLVIPSFIRNPIYEWVAKNRYMWFGKADVCWIPEQNWKTRFLE